MPRAHADCGQFVVNFALCNVVADFPHRARAVAIKIVANLLLFAAPTTNKDYVDVRGARACVCVRVHGCLQPGESGAAQRLACGSH